MEEDHFQESILIYGINEWNLICLRLSTFTFPTISK